MEHSKWKGTIVAMLALVTGPALNAAASPGSLVERSDTGPNVAAQRLGNSVGEIEWGEDGQLVSLRAPEPVVNEVDLRDREAYLAQRDAEDLMVAKVDPNVVGVHPGDPLPPGELGDYIAASIDHWNAEVRLDVARDDAWNSLPSISAVPMLVHEPLQLAMLEIHVEVRRRLGSGNHTEVPGLEEDLGCAGDVVAERLLYTYGSALSQPFGSGGATVASELERIARQVVCVSAPQLEDLEAALHAAFDQVSANLVDRGFGGIVPVLARALAPIQVLVLDARKHAGAESLAWQWFVEQGDKLDDTVAASGWATGELMLWDRRQGILVGFPGCGGSLGVNPSCVDLLAFLASLRDPRALGLGDCAFAGMISRGQDLLAAGRRYACPMNPCAPPPGTKLVTDRSAKEQRWTNVRKRWPGLEGGARDDMESICQGGPVGARQGLANVAERCASIDFSGTRSPFETYTGCMVRSLQGPSGPGVLALAGAELRGVPTGSECELTKGGSKKKPKPKAKSPKKGRKKGKTKLTKKKQPKYPPPTVSPSDKRTTKWKVVKSPNGLTIRFRLKAGKAQVTWSGKKVTYAKLRALMAAHGQDTTVAGSNALYALWKRRGDCDGASDCDHSCTSVGKQLSAARSCSDKLLDEAARALGRPNHKDLVRRIEWVSRPTGDEPVKSKKGFGLCGDGLGPKRQPSHCGLVLCSDGSFAAAGGEGCTCRDNQPLRWPKNPVCLTLRCADGAMPAADCTCRDEAGQNTTIPPKPGPQPTIEAAGYTGGKFVDISDFGVGRGNAP